jgi:hypothetical protein
MAFN